MGSTVDSADQVLAEDGSTDVTLLQQAPTLTRLDIGPWCILHAILFSLWWSGHSSGTYSFLHALAVFFAVLGHALTALAQHWSVHAWRNIAFVESRSISNASHVYIRAPTKVGVKPPAPAIVPLERCSPTSAHSQTGALGKDLLCMPPFRFSWHSLTFELSGAGPGIWRAVSLLHVLPVDRPLSQYAQWVAGVGKGNGKAGWTKQEADVMAARFGANAMSVPLPSFGRLFLEHATAPFFVFQIACVGLWCLDEYVWYSLFTLGTLVAMEATLVGQRIATAKQLRSMRPPPHAVWALRNGTWCTVQSPDLVPCDVISIAREPAVPRVQAGAGAGGGSKPATHASPTSVPCPGDVLLLTGSVVVNEAMLTGESTPQIKEAPPDTEEERGGKEGLDAFVEGSDKTHTRHIVYSGTLIVTANGEDTGAGGVQGVPPPPDKGAIGVILRTGPHTAQGELLRSLLQAQERVSVADKEAFIFIGCMLIFAVAAAYYVLTAGLADPRRDRWKLGLHVIMILTTVVPPELPVELSMAVNMSLAGLIKRGIYCTEPNRIPAAGKVDVVAFDKTGTLTADRFRVQGVALLGAGPDALLVSGPTGLPPATQLVMLGCHALVAVRVQQSVPATPARPGMPAQQAATTWHTEYAGDPIEHAAMDALGWNVDEAGVARPKDSSGASLLQTVLGGGTGPAVKVVHRWPFSSALKRMTCATVLQGGAASLLQASASKPAVFSGAGTPSTLAQASASMRLPESVTGPSGGVVVLVTKGAPEVIEGMLAHVPEGYTATHSRLAAGGARVLALAFRVLDKSATVTTVRGMDRKVAEAAGTMTFAGFLSVSSPVKTDSERVVQELIESDHRVLMITGDAPLTACAVAAQLGMGQRGAKGTFVLDLDKDGRLVVTQPKEPSIAPVLVSSLSALRTGVPSTALLAVTGRALDGVGRVWGPDDFAQLCMTAVVFARTSPAQKERIIGAIHDIGSSPGSSSSSSPIHYTAMVGDGSNDTGALKRAHLGLAVLSNPKLEDRYDRERLDRAAKRRAAAQATGSAARGPGAVAAARLGTVEAEEDEGEIEALLKSEQERTAAMASAYGSAEDEEGEGSNSLTSQLLQSAMSTASASAAANGDAGKRAQMDALHARIRQMEAEAAAEGGMGGPPIVALGDASMAAPLTSKLPTPASILEVLRQGRCTLVTTHQMFKILGVNALVAAYMMSVLHLADVKLGDSQATSNAMAAAACFFLLSWAKPIRRLSVERPHTSVFHPGLVLSVLGQFAVHTAALLAASALVGHNPWVVAPPSPEEMADGVVAALTSSDVAAQAAALGLLGDATALGGEALGEVPMGGLEGQELLTSKLFGGADAVPAASTSDSWWGGEPLIPPSSFKPSHVNTAVFLVYAAAQACTFLVSYNGPPFMEPLSKQTSLVRMCGAIYIACIVGALGVVPELNSYLQLLPLETMRQRVQLAGLIVVDALACMVVEVTARAIDRWHRPIKRIHT